MSDTIVVDRSNGTTLRGHMVVCDSAVTERRQALYWVNKGQKYLFRALNAFIVSGGRPSIVFAGRRRDATRAVVLWIIELMRILGTAQFCDFLRRAGYRVEVNGDHVTLGFSSNSVVR
jgi:hypothetical protein